MLKMEYPKVGCLINLELLGTRAYPIHEFGLWNWQKDPIRSGKILNLFPS